ncbi:MAG: tRNA (adenosine(37)-N6)-dimethylallyltransferase MiaA [Candidatus Liptonbacteria bacterium RIFCSPLOWO2_01_FULL_52_25]|uniref:tRNA dimethylallyltransferase n=1 Tax=Candidatus Liptonbacteria bacterium RIFCSPLOWO2_01_FULL_52_25 TaxID=1798650 RepID=A0A1G2CJ41_9BACT|nr:MAG: tRNA (adenosine(37)-N6)-dimethylallyltransferase MiaA [Candidatus Liptonbacteria bacterium RIFCSPLOWO2_01_FULL_52_25]
MRQLSISRQKVIVVVGPTASGKSALAIRIAKKFNGEVISADSRQVYRGMDIGTGKVPISYATRRGAWTKSSIPPKGGIPLYRGVPHHLLDVASPRTNFTVAHYQRLARRAIHDILRRGKLPILCGGTGLYIDAALYDYALPAVPPNAQLRRTLEKKPADTLFAELQRRDPRRAVSIDRHNKRRLVRALEIIRATGAVVPSREEVLRRTSPYDILKIGLNPPHEALKKKIRARILEWLRHGLMREVKGLRAKGISWKRLHDFGLTYDYAARHLRGFLTKEEMTNELSRAIYQYAKRQRRWFRKNKDVMWVQNEKDATRAMRAFLA